MLDAVPTSTRPSVQHPAGVVAVLNARAGSASGPGARAALAVLEQGAPLHVARTASTDELQDVVGSLDGRRLVVMGGDGSVNAVLTALHATDRLRTVGPLGLIPLGTGNDLARSLGLPVADPERAARTALSGRVADVELVVEDGGPRPTVVVNAAHAGIGASAARRALRLKPLLGPLAYPVGAIAAGVAARPWHLRVTVDGRLVHDGDRGVLLVAVTIGSSIGGGAQLSPAATPHDGLVDVVVSTSTGPLARAHFAARMLRGRHVERHDVATTRGSEVVVEAVGDRPFVVNTDGDLSREATRFAWRSLGHAWQVLLP